MASVKTKILILEDDETFGKALKEAFSRAGHHVLLAARPEEAKDIFARTSGIEYLFCDCLLPQMTGLAFVKQVRSAPNGPNLKIILMSGIYTDKEFIQEAIQSSKAVEFLKKPFEIAEALKIVKSEKSPEVDSDSQREREPQSRESSARKLLYQMFSNPSVTNRQKRKVIESVQEISGFDLPFLYSLLAETKSNGYLNIYNSDGSVSGVSFSNGNIVGVDIDDKTTFLGEMLIQSGFAVPQDVHNALKDKNNRRIGDYLIQLNQLSPHAFDLMLIEQMNIRLVRTIVEQKIRVNFVAASVDLTNPRIDVDSLTLYLHDWIASKLSISWLKSFYVIWSGNSILKSPMFRDDHPALNMPLVRSLDGLSSRLDQKWTLTQFLDHEGYSEVAVYKAIHFLLTKGMIIFAQRVAFTNSREQLKTLKKIWHEIENKNSFEIVGYLESAVVSGDLDSAIREFMKLIGERPSESEVEVFQLWSKIKNSTEEAVEETRDSLKVDQYRQASLKNEAEAKLKASSMFEEAKKCLHLNQFLRAENILTTVTKLAPETPQLHLYNTWAKLGAVDQTRKNSILKEVELEIVQIPADERYDGLFPFVIGLYNRLKGDVAGARKSFEKSIALDNSFIPARRELSLLAAQNKKTDVFNMDLKQVVSGFFKKR